MRGSVIPIARLDVDPALRLSGLDWEGLAKIQLVSRE